MPPKKCDDCGWVRRIGQKGIGWHWLLTHSAKAAAASSEFEDRRGHCEHCCKDFAIIHAHIAVHLRLRPPAPRDTHCDHCEKTTQKKLLWHHYLRAHTPKGLPARLPFDSPKPFSTSVVCDACSKCLLGKNFFLHWCKSHAAKSTKNDLRRKKMKEDRMSNRVCDDCGARPRAKVKEHILGHRQRKRKTMQWRDPQRLRRKCDDCDNFRTGPRDHVWSHWVRAHLPVSSPLARHIHQSYKRWRERNSFFCDQCGKLPARKNAFRHWLIQHSGRAELAEPCGPYRKPFACESCGELFCRKKELYRHFVKAHGTTLPL